MNVERRGNMPAPPPVKRHTLRAAIVLGCGAVIALLLLLVVINLDGADSSAGAPRIADDDVIELIAPPASLNEQQLATSGNPNSMAGTLPTELPQGGWIDMPDAEGQIAQKYRFTRLNPNPKERSAGWIQLEQPEAQMFFSDDQAVTLRADEALAYAPSRALEEGTMTGSVIIEVYRLGESRTINPGRDSPTVIIHTDEASFDNQHGQVRCPGEIRLESPGKAELVGFNLTLDINDIDDRLETLELARVQYIKLITPEKQPQQGTVAAMMGVKSGKGGYRAALQVRPPTSGSDSLDVQFYELMLTENIIITQGPMDRAKIARGDALSIIFSSETQGLGDALAMAGTIPNPLPRGKGGVRGLYGNRIAHNDNSSSQPLDTQPMTLTAYLAACAIAQTNPSDRADVPVPGENETVITMNGPLRIRPVDNPERKPASPEDSRLELSGSPVTLDDEFERAHATAGSILYYSLAKRVELVAGENHPVHVDSPQLTAGGERFWLAQADGRGGFEGAGWLRPEGQGATAEDQPQPIDNNRGDAAALIEELDVRWSEGVEISFTPGTEEGSLGSIKRVLFNGNVRVKSKDGDIDSDRLELTVRPDADGKPAPDTMTATGNVRTADADRALWADSLLVRFMDVAKPPAEQDGAGETANDMFGGGKTTVRELKARGDVQVRLADGSRVFADELIGDGVSETLELFAPTITIAAGRLFMEQNDTIIIRKGDQTAFGPRAGRLRVFNRPLDTNANMRIERPIVSNEENPPVVSASWNESMLYDHAFGGGAGAVDLRGKVKAESSRNPLEYNTMQGDAVMLELAFVEKVKEKEKEKEIATPQADAGEEIINMDDRRLARFVARGNAKIESRTWREGDEAHAEKPRIFYAAGPHIEYNDITFEARIPGDGTLLMRDEWPNNPGEGGRPNAGNDRASFSGKGTTQFKWKNELHMQHQMDDRYKINLSGEVTILHQSLDEQIATMTCEEMEAIVSRLEETREREAGLDFGGAMDLRRIAGKGAVLVKTALRTVECDAFDYNVDTQLARASAMPGRMITILTEGATHPIQAREVLWNMARDSITIVQGAGTAAP